MVVVVVCVCGVGWGVGGVWGGLGGGGDIAQVRWHLRWFASSHVNSWPPRPAAGQRQTASRHKTRHNMQVQHPT